MANSFAVATGSGAAVTVTTSSSVTLAAGDVLVVGVLTPSNSTTVSGVVFNSGAQSLSSVDNQTINATTACNLHVWALVSGSAGTGTVTGTLSLAVNCAIIACVITGAASGVGYRDTAQKTSGSSTTPSLTITSEAGDDALAFVGFRNTNSSWTADSSPVSELGTITSGTGTSHVRISLLRETGSASTSPSGVAGSSKDWVAVGFNINAATAGASPNRVRQAQAMLRAAANAHRQARAALLRTIANSAPLPRAFSNTLYGTATPGTGLSGVGHDRNGAASRLRRIKRRRN